MGSAMHSKYCILLKSSSNLENIPRNSVLWFLSSSKTDTNKLECTSGTGRMKTWNIVCYNLLSSARYGELDPLLHKQARNAICLDAGYEMPTFCHTGSNVLYSVCVCTRVLSGANCHQVQLASRLWISHNQYQPHTLHSRLLGTSNDLMTIS